MTGRFISLPDGTRLVPQAGNTGASLFLDPDPKRLPAGRVYWSVQAVAAAFTGGPFAPTQTFDLAPPPGPTIRLDLATGVPASGEPPHQSWK